MKKLTHEDVELLVMGLQIRMGIIETGQPMLRAADIANGHSGKIQALSTDQMKAIIRQEELVKALYNGEIGWLV